MKIRPGIRIWLASICFCLIALTGCKGPMEMTLVGSPGMNSGGNAAIVRVYELTGDSNFQRSTLESFWQNDEEALGSELIAPKQEVLLYPNQEKTLELEIGKETRYVGIAADLRNASPDQWRRVFPASQLRGKKVTVTVGDDRLNVSPH